MIDKMKYIETENRKYPLIFNLNVIEQVQEKYGDLDKWSASITPTDGLPSIKDLKWTITQMINEGIDIENETNEIKQSFVTDKQVGRLLTQLGLQNISGIVMGTVSDGMGESEEDPNESTTQNQQ